MTTTVSVSIPSYDFPHSIRDSSKVKRGQQLELTGEVMRIDDKTVTIALGPLVTVAIDKARLAERQNLCYLGRWNSHCRLAFVAVVSVDYMSNRRKPH